MARQEHVCRDWPEFEAPLLRSVLAAFTRRRKAIRYKADLSCTREFSESASGAIERLNLDLRGGSIRLSVWADGILWLGVAIPAPGRNAGWAFRDSFHGDLGDIAPETLVGMVETTLALPWDSDPVGQQPLREVWRRVHPS